MSAYIIVNIDITDPEAYERYKDLAAASNQIYGGRYLARGGRAEVLEGAFDPKRMVIVEFPSYEAALAWYGSAEYAPAKRVRQGSARSTMILLDGVS